VENTFFTECNEEYSQIYKKLPELPFSNIYIAKRLSTALPENSVLYLGILNSLRSWNFFDISHSVHAYSNVGGFGIDGVMSSLVGASLVNSHKLYFGVLGDLSFFYDMNCLGNHHIGNNLRIILINNGRGMEFRLYTHRAAFMGEEADKFVAAAEHFGCKSPKLVKHYASDLGFEYISASNKEEFEKACERFLSPNMSDKSILLEIFTTAEDENRALKLVSSVLSSPMGAIKGKLKEAMGNNGVRVLRNVLGKN
jgi:2-succinyl-5-enolpyruvyl-6-hydroxy-3-cyclohexene-1-carboxylate synthase